MLIDAAQVLAAIDAEIVRLAGLHRARDGDLIRGVQHARHVVMAVMRNIFDPEGLETMAPAARAAVAHVALARLKAAEEGAAQFADTEAARAEETQHD